jgi:hypothetical protein
MEYSTRGCGFRRDVGVSRLATLTHTLMNPMPDITPDNSISFGFSDLLDLVADFSEGYSGFANRNSLVERFPSGCHEV